MGILSHPMTLSTYHIGSWLYNETHNDKNLRAERIYFTFQICLSKLVTCGLLKYIRIINKKYLHVRGMLLALILSFWRWWKCWTVNSASTKDLELYTCRSLTCWVYLQLCRICLPSTAGRSSIRGPKEAVNISTKSCTSSSK
jgi:hypothetical protein